MSKVTPITIVGGGATGLALFVQLIDKMVATNDIRFSLILIERSQEISTGIVYSTHFDSCICNQRYTKMSLFPDNANHFADWIFNNKQIWQELFPDFDPSVDFFPPRRLYGLYLKDIFTKACEKAKVNNITFQVINGEVKSVEMIKRFIGREYRLILDDGKELVSKKVIFALGNFPPTTYKELRSVKNYFSTPWPDTKLVSDIPKNESVVILGTRLTAIDVAITLISNGHTGKISMLSRKGLLPKVKQQFHPPLTCKEGLIKGFERLTKGGKTITLKEVSDLVDEQMLVLGGKKIDWGITSFPPTPIIESLKRDIDNAKENKIIWQSMVADMGELAEKFWNALSEESRKEFFEKYGKFWFIFLAMPIKNGEKILSYIQGGQLTVSGGLENVKFNEDTNKFEVKYNDTSIETSYVVNATDVGMDIHEIDSPLLKGMDASGLISAHPYGGVNVEFTSLKTINSEGVVSKNLYCIGYLTRGVHFYTNDTSRLSAHAKRIVEDLFI